MDLDDRNRRTEGARLHEGTGELALHAAGAALGMNDKLLQGPALISGARI